MKTETVKTRHAELGLSDAQVLEMYYYMVLTRRLDERLWLMQRGGKIPFVVSAQGQEAAQVGAVYALQRGKDWLLPYYRDLGKILVFGMTPRDIMLGCFAREGDPSSNGRQMAHHWGHRRLNIVSGSSPVSTQIPHTVGVALAARMRGEDTVAMCSFGEGSSNQGDFHEGLNFAGVHRLGCVFHCQNNEYAISVHVDKQVAGGSVADRAVGYGMPGVVVDGQDFLEVYGAFRAAVQRGRRGEGSTLIESRVARMTPHSSDDDDRTYRPKEELEQVRGRDPLTVARKYLEEVGLLDPTKEKDIEARVMRQVDDATEWSETQPYPSPDTLFRHVYKEG